MTREEMIEKIMENIGKLNCRFLHSVMVFTSTLAE